MSPLCDITKGCFPKVYVLAQISWKVRLGWKKRSRQKDAPFIFLWSLLTGRRHIFLLENTGKMDFAKYGTFNHSSGSVSHIHTPMCKHLYAGHLCCTHTTPFSLTHIPHSPFPQKHRESASVTWITISEMQPDCSMQRHRYCQVLLWGRGVVKNQSVTDSAGIK